MNEKRVAVVTGAFGCLGLAICRKLAVDGFTIAALDKPDAQKETEFQRLINGAERAARAVCIPVDVTDATSVARAFEQVVDQGGRVDVLVNNAGIREIVSPLELSFEEWNRVLAVNLSGPFLCSQAAARLMIQAKAGGSIVNISSITGLVGVESRAAYCSSKHGLIGLTRSLTADLGPHGIRVNAVCPGLTVTPLTQSYAGTAAMQRALESTVPLSGGLATPEDIADAVAFLAGPRSRFVSGVFIPVDGGFVATKSYDPTGLSATFR